MFLCRGVNSSDLCFSPGAAVDVYPWEGLDAREGVRRKSVVKSLDLGVKTIGLSFASSVA